jgi:uncharacterized membrane protein
MYNICIKCMYIYSCIYATILHRKQWTEFNVPSMLLGCFTLVIIIAILLHQIINTVKTRTSIHTNDNNENNDNNNDDTNNKNENNNDNNNNNNDNNNNDNTYQKIISFFSKNVYFCAVMCMGIFHGVSTFSNSYIIEVYTCIYLCI